MKLWAHQKKLTLAILFGAFSLLTTADQASAESKQSRDEPIARLFWQDREDRSVKWVNVQRRPGEIDFGKPQRLAGFPKLDVERQELVQMEQIGSTIVVGVRDDDEGKFQSGYVVINDGIEEISHGDHFDFKYHPTPEVTRILLNQAQGNPAHMYCYDKQIYLANDRLNGFTRLDPTLLNPQEPTDGITFHRGGGGHITLAASNNKIAYSTWISGDGKIDVVDLSRTGEESIRYSFNLPVGGLHGAIANSGKVFFAPSKGIYWLPIDTQFLQNAETVQPQFMSLGDSDENGPAYRTGSFTSQLNWIMFNTGRGENSAFCLVDASVATPKLVKIPVPVADGLTLVSPETVRSYWGKRYAFVFQNQSGGDQEEYLTILELDPNNDNDFSDAKVLKTILVGASQVAGHYGHHSISFDRYATYAFLTNPGTGEIWTMSLKTLEVIGKFQVGGTPTKILATGGRNYH